MIFKTAHRRMLAIVSACAALSAHAQAAPNFADKIARPLHYLPAGGAFVVENGKEFFNRPLYGANTPFRVDAGDRPEVSLYLPGRGGNLRLGIRTAAGAKWLNDAASITTRYVDGTMRYTIRDPLLGDGALELVVIAMHETDGVILRAQRDGASTACELISAYGGVTGVRGVRDGDIGTEREPISQYFQLKPEFCADNTFDLTPTGFMLRSGAADVAGIVPEGSTSAIADASKWNALDELLASAQPEAKFDQPVVVTRFALEADRPAHLALQRQRASATTVPTTSPTTRPATVPAVPTLPVYQPTRLPSLFDGAEKHMRRVARQLVVETPDEFINAAVPALCVAADGVWDSGTKAYMHGAVAWRMPLLGWRGAYAGDALGQHGRTRDHLMRWFPRQNVEPIDPRLTGEPATVPADESVRLARNEPMLHSNGDLTNSHYDMNLPAIDILFRHLLWTGDLEYARKVWPVVERHLAWERRLFRRPFGPDKFSPDKLPLYEGYAAIWASDDLAYNGGGATHTSAYNLYHNRMAARVAKLIGKDAAPYEREAELIGRAMREHLWLADRGWFAEWKDLLGLQLVHPNAALWTFYHTIDSEVTTPMEAWQMSRFVDAQVPKIPIRGEGVPPGEWHTLPTTTWMPYVWSTNNVVMGEAAHTALAYWQAGRADAANALFKGLLLDSMYQGLCPGNVGMATGFDMARGETQRDFSDGVGATSRALVEGLFGIKPDALAGEIVVSPGFPAEWNRASIRHTDLTFTFERRELVDRYTLESRFPKPMNLRLRVPALRDDVASVTIDGEAAKWRSVEEAVGRPMIEVLATSAKQGGSHEVAITWKGEVPAAPVAAEVSRERDVALRVSTATILEVEDPQRAIDDVVRSEHVLRGFGIGTSGDRTLFARVKQGAMRWRLPVGVHLAPHVDPTYPMTDWTKVTSPIKGVWDCIKLEPLFNDRVTQIFRNEYRSPRSPYTSLATPLQGFGSWAHWDPAKDRHATANIDDGGLRALARNGGGRITLPQGVPFETPGTGDAAQGGDAKNVAFVSQWDNFPRELTVPLTGRASHAYLLMAGSTNSMQSRFDNGEVIVTYADGTSDRLALENPTTWWPIEQDYRIDDFAFRRPEPIPLRVDLKTGDVRSLDVATFKGKGGKIDGGAATVLDLRLRPDRELKSVTVRALANEVVIGLMSLTLDRTTSVPQ